MRARWTRVSSICVYSPDGYLQECFSFTNFSFASLRPTRIDSNRWISKRVMDDDYLYIINIFDWLGGKLLREFTIFQSNIFSIHLLLTLVYVPRRFLLLFFSSLEFLFLFHTSFISRVVYHRFQQVNSIHALSRF